MNESVPVQHIVVLMLENRSYDHLLGRLPTNGFSSPPDGVQSTMANPDSSGAAVRVEVTTDPALTPGPRHDLRAVLDQLANGNQGFVVDFEKVVGAGAPNRGIPMLSYEPTGPESPVWMLSNLASRFGVSDHWFCSLPAETWPNRFFAHAATSAGHVANDIDLYQMPTIFDRLDGDQRYSGAFRWALYCDLIPQVACFERLGLEWLRTRGQPESRFRTLAQFRQDCASGRLPMYAFIEPAYLGPYPDDDHPPHDLFAGEALLRQVFAAVRSSPAWPSIALLVTFDEHGGFFDHVPPPTNAAAPDDSVDRSGSGFDFRRLGPRVPFLLVAERVPAGTVIRPPDGSLFDHTSILATVERLWGLAPLSRRDAAAADLLPWLGPPAAVPEAAAPSTPPAQLLDAEREAVASLPLHVSLRLPGWDLLEGLRSLGEPGGQTDLGVQLLGMVARLAAHQIGL